MAIGYPKNKDSVDNVVGELAQSVNRNFRRAVQLKTELDSFTDAQLEGQGYTPTAKDFRPSLRRVWGILGDF